MSEITALPPTSVAAPETVAAPRETVDWRRVYETSEGRAVLAILAGLLFAFAPFFAKLAGLWFEPESMYSHGPLVPLMAAYIVYDRWPKLRGIPVRGVTWAILPIFMAIYGIWLTSRTLMMGSLGALFMLCVGFAILFVGGWRWLAATFGSLLFLVFCLPFWSGIVDRATQPLQLLSTDMAMRILDLSGLHPLRIDTTNIFLDHFQLDVAAACSGVHTTLALLCFACFFILLNRGRWYSAAGLLAILLPFSLVVNGLRIALVGIVGNAFGADAGKACHDYGGYVVLIVCFLLLAQLTRLMGFKQ